MSVFGMAGVRTFADMSEGAGKRSTQKTGVEHELEVLRGNLAKALMINEALWELMREKLGVSQDEFFKKLYEIDMRDGKLDGQNQARIVQCPSCKRNNAGRHAACIYCGTVLNESVFRMK